MRDIPTLTSIFGASITATAIESRRRNGLRVRSMQEFSAASGQPEAGTPS